MSQTSHSESNDQNEEIHHEYGQELFDDNKNVCQILEGEDVNESPIDISIARAIPVNIAPKLCWFNFELPPKKMKITNTGHTVILSGKWGQERPYISHGPLAGKYVFSQMHFHWGINDMEGSEHTFDGCQYSGELHIVTFKSCYLTQEAALKEKDGIVILAYVLKLQEPTNPDFQSIVDNLSAIAKAHTSQKVAPVNLSGIIKQFESDYYVYRGAVSTSDCVHQVLWLVTRVPIGVSSEQTDAFRYLLDNEDNLIKRNFRPVQPLYDRHVFHILPSKSKFSTLLPAPIAISDKTITQIFRVQLSNPRLSTNKEDRTSNEDLSLMEFNNYIDFALYYLLWCLSTLKPSDLTNPQNHSIMI